MADPLTAKRLLPVVPIAAVQLIDIIERAVRRHKRLPNIVGTPSDCPMRGPNIRLKTPSSPLLSSSIQPLLMFRLFFHSTEP